MSRDNLYSVFVTEEEASKLMIFSHLLSKSGGVLDKTKDNTLISLGELFNKVAKRIVRQTKKQSVDDINKLIKKIDWTLEQEAIGNHPNFYDARSAAKQLADIIDNKTRSAQR